MYSFEFKAKLKRLNGSLYVAEDRRSHVLGDYWSAPLRLSFGKQRDKLTSGDYAQIGGQEERYIRDLDAGLVPEFMCSVPVGWVPEYDVIGFDKSKHRHVVLARGWRSILMNLVEKKAVSLDRARVVFDCSDLGQKAYDKLDLGQKIAQVANAK